MPVSIQNRQRRVKIQTALIKSRLQQILAFMDSADQELSVVFANDTLMRTLNRTYRHQDRTTNVLAFPQQPAGQNDPSTILLGDVIVSLPTAAREAQALHQSVEDRVLYLLLHGTLHLLGYDHERSETERQRMQAREQEVLAFLRSSTTVSRRRRGRTA